VCFGFDYLTTIPQLYIYNVELLSFEHWIIYIICLYTPRPTATYHNILKYNNDNNIILFMCGPIQRILYLYSSSMIWQCKLLRFCAHLKYISHLYGYIYLYIYYMYNNRKLFTYIKTEYAGNKLEDLDEFLVQSGVYDLNEVDMF